MESKGETDKFTVTILLGAFNTYLSAADRTKRLNNISEDTRDMKQYYLFKTDNILSHKLSLNKYKMIEKL